MTMLPSLQPTTFAQAAQALAGCTGAGRAVRIQGAGTKPWTADGPEPGVVLATTGLNRILAHDPGDMTATLEAGVTLQEAQARFAEAEQMLALDPPTRGADGEEATIGGIVATADCGPLAHRYGGPRDLVVGMTVALADGTIARSGGTVIKNVAGYDIAKLFCGGFGTLGLILSVNVRLHPRLASATATGESPDSERLCAAARRLAAMPAELDCLDLAWAHGAGRLLARCAGAQAQARAQRVAAAMADAGLEAIATTTEDEPLWERQRAAQRAASSALLRIAVPPTELPGVIATVEMMQGTLVARAALGHLYVTLAPERVAALRERLPRGATSVLRDRPAGARAEIANPWGAAPEALALMRAIKQRFDPAGTCNPGSFVGGI